MKIINLGEGSKMYTSNVYFVLGTWNTLDDVNTLIDVGRDPFVIEQINDTWTGVGKHKVDKVKVVLTHSHYDHTSLLPQIRENFKPQVHAFSVSLEGVDHLLEDEQVLRLGDKMFEVIHTPGHSTDSICLYCHEEHILFSGDMPIRINTVNGSYDNSFFQALQKICRRDIRVIYPGHGPPLFNRCNEMLYVSLSNVKKSMA